MNKNGVAISVEADFAHMQMKYFEAVLAFSHLSDHLKKHGLRSKDLRGTKISICGIKPILTFPKSLEKRLDCIPETEERTRLSEAIELDTLAKAALDNQNSNIRIAIAYRIGYLVSQNGLDEKLTKYFKERSAKGGSRGKGKVKSNFKALLFRLFENMSADGSALDFHRILDELNEDSDTLNDLISQLSEPLPISKVFVDKDKKTVSYLDRGEERDVTFKSVRNVIGQFKKFKQIKKISSS